MRKRKEKAVFTHVSSKLEKPAQKETVFIVFFFCFVFLILSLCLSTFFQSPSQVLKHLLLWRVSRASQHL